MKKYKTIGILGGMGPEATAALYLQIIQLFQQEFAARYDSDFPKIILVNLPLPDVVEDAVPRVAIEKMLVEGTRNLEKAGADFIVIPCNTVTYYIDKMRSAVSIPVINILEETASEIRSSRIKAIGLLATATTIRSRIYEDALKGFLIMIPEEQEQQKITAIIMNILSGKKAREDRTQLLRLIKSLKRRGAEKVILGCTELPLLIKDNEDVFDTLEILAKSAVDNSIK